MQDPPALNYFEIAPSTPLARHIECYWFLSGRPAAFPDAHRILPDGCMEIVINLGAPIRRVNPNGIVEVQPRRMLVGQMDQHVTIRPDGQIDVVGIRFQPAGAFGFLRFPLSRLRNQTVAADEVLANFLNVSDLLTEASDTPQRVSAIEAFFLAHLSQHTLPGDALLEAAVGSVLRNAGRISVDALAREVRMGSRELERRFHEKVGLGPKRFCRIVRFQDVFRRHGLAEDAWAAVAVDCGYYDQPHFIKEFKRITGETPPEFFSRLDPVTGFFTRASR
jgi:AraC-like DNA-binding protein